MTEGKVDDENLEKKHLSLRLKRIYALLLALNIVFLGAGVFEWMVYFNITKNLTDVAMSVLVGAALFLLYSTVLWLSLDRLLQKILLRTYAFGLYFRYLYSSLFL
jgi:hypothetical protein